MSAFETSVEEARQLYEDLANHTTTVGAYCFVSREDEERLQLVERQTRIAGDYEIVKRPASRCSGDYAPQLLFDVPSPWHAVIHMLVNNRSWLDGRVGRGRPTSLIYRGQADCRWELEPSISRAEIDSDAERLAMEAFGALSRRFFQIEAQYNLHLGLLSFDEFCLPGATDLLHRCAAQHYGIRTQLLDFTTDPAVAVWFACRDAAAAGAPVAALFGVPMEFLQANGTAAIVFPHPFVTRIYRQNGVFVDYEGGAFLRALCVEVRFPPDPDFRLLREFLPTDVLPADKWWADLVEASRAIACDHGLEALNEALDAQPLLAQAIDLDAFGLEPIFLPDFAQRESKIELVRESVEFLTNMLLHLTTQLDGSDPRVINAAIRMCVAHSAPTLRALLPLVRERIDALPAASRLPGIVRPMMKALEGAMG